MVVNSDKHKAMKLAFKNVTEGAPKKVLNGISVGSSEALLKIVELQGAFKISASMTSFSCNQNWVNALREIEKKEGNRSVMVTGQQNTAKSTFIQFALNSLLSKDTGQKLYVLDCDPGQPMFTLSGLVSLT